MAPVVVLVGAPGAGKTSVGRLLADLLGVDFRDTDADIETIAGKPIPEIFLDEGEDHFRALERDAVATALATFDGVLALGGGAVLAESTRAALAGHTVVHLAVELGDAIRRVGLGAGRPLLAVNPRATLRHLLEARRPLYAEVATVEVTTGGRTPEEVAQAVLAALPGLPGGRAGTPADGITRIAVGGEQPYEVLVGRDLHDALPALLPGADRVAVLHAAPLADRAAALTDRLTAAGMRPLPIRVPDAEAGKTIEVAADCWDRLGQAGFTRTDAVVGLGGGAATDLAGFVAGCWLRGVRWVPVPTSLLGMVDAAIGGKTGINTAAGKNLVGAFHPPAGVLCDLATLDTLPDADLRAGLAEVVKCGFIADPVILDLIERDPAAATRVTGAVLRELVERSVRVKAEVVTGDLRESGRREILNYGHTLAHAIEKVEGYRWRHGDAVSVGLVYAAALALRAGRLDATTAARHRTVLAALGLPTTYHGTGSWPELLATMRVDKKARGALLRFVVLDGPGRPGILAGPDDELLAAAFTEVGG
jgi:shikimate kinase/3-dehydroquinate synthase